MRDPVADGRIPAEAGPPCEPTEMEKMKRELTHVPFQPRCTSCFKSKSTGRTTQTIERSIEDSYLVLTDVAASDGLNVLSMHVKSFGCGTSTVVENEGCNRHAHTDVRSEDV